MKRKLHQVFLMVSDLDTSMEFYRTVLGLPIRESGSRSAEFDTGRCTLMLEEDFDVETLAEFGLEPPGDDRGSGAVVVLEVENVDEIHERADEAGADVLSPPREVDWGRKMFLIRDPDGYVLEISRPL